MPGVCCPAVQATAVLSIVLHSRTYPLYWPLCRLYCIAVRASCAATRTAQLCTLAVQDICCVCVRLVPVSLLLAVVAVTRIRPTLSADCAGMLVVQATGAVYWDAVGSIAVSALLGVVAITLIQRNRKWLIGKSMPKVRPAVNMKSTYVRAAVMCCSRLGACSCAHVVQLFSC